MGSDFKSAKDQGLSVNAAVSLIPYLRKMDYFIFFIVATK